MGAVPLVASDDHIPLRQPALVTHDFFAVIVTPVPFGRARETGAQK